MTCKQLLPVSQQNTCSQEINRSNSMPFTTAGTSTQSTSHQSTRKDQCNNRMNNKTPESATHCRWSTGRHHPTSLPIDTAHYTTISGGKRREFFEKLNIAPFQYSAFGLTNKPTCRKRLAINTTFLQCSVQ